MDCLHLNLNSGSEVGFSPSKADVGDCQFFDTLVVAIAVVIVEPSATCEFCIPAYVVLESMVSAIDISL